MTSQNESSIRKALLVLASVMFAGTLVELWLADHTQEPAQFVPFVLCILGLLALLAVLFRPSRNTLRALQATMLLNIVGGLVGIGLHLAGNYTFEQEIRPNAAANELILDTLKGANPLIAPGLLVFIALMVLIAIYRHPAGRKDARSL